MKIGDLAKATGVSIPTIRLYEREGLIEGAGRSSGKFRLFTPEHEIRLRFIRRLRSLGFTLDDVRLLLSMDRECSDPELIRIQGEARARVNALAQFIEHFASIRDGRASAESIETVFEPIDGSLGSDKAPFTDD